MLKLNRGEYMNIDKEINKIWSYYDNFNYQEALNICDKILNRYPYFEEILEVKAYIFYINGYLEVLFAGKAIFQKTIIHLLNFV